MNVRRRGKLKLGGCFGFGGFVVIVIGLFFEDVLGFFFLFEFIEWFY